jgi:hypothetical protein
LPGTPLSGAGPARVCDGSMAGVVIEGALSSMAIGERSRTLQIGREDVGLCAQA